MMTNEATFDEVTKEAPMSSLWSKATSGIRALLGKKPKAPAMEPETEVDILLEDTIYGVTVRFTGKDNA